MPSNELIMIRGVIAGLSAEEQAKIAEIAQKIRALVADCGDCGIIALGLVGQEMADAVD